MAKKAEKKTDKTIAKKLSDTKPKQKRQTTNYSVKLTANEASVRFVQIGEDDIELAQEEMGAQEIIDRDDYDEKFCFEVDREGRIVVMDESGDTVCEFDTLQESGCQIIETEKPAVGDGQWRGEALKEGKSYAVVEDWETGGMLELSVECDGDFDISKLGLNLTSSGYLLGVSYEGKVVKIGDNWGMEDEDECPESQESYYYAVVPKSIARLRKR